MKIKNHIRITLLVLFVVCIAGLIMLTGCGDKVSDIYVQNADTPRLNYVQGQDLDLSKGLLTAIVNDEEVKIPLTAEGVTVSGYDKNVLGDQLLTITYGEITTNITVNVIPRAVAENFETRYFIGDTFNKDMGRLKIASDDAKIFNVNMNDDKISLVSFDSNKAGKATVTVRYSDGTVSYDCQFEVTVYDTSNMEFVPPTKTDYLSHDSALDINGGYFTIISSDSQLTKHVPLSADMVSGFDLSAATLENRDAAYQQTLTVSYLGQTFTYTVNITYSGISIINHYTQNVFANMDWAGEMTEAQTMAALDAIREYYKLSDADKAVLSEETIQTVARAGAIAVSDLFEKEMENYSRTFYMNEAGNLYFNCQKYDETVLDLAKIKDETTDLNLYKQLLRKIETDFAELIIKDEKPAVEYIRVYSEELEQTFIQILEHLIEAHEALENIPKNWTKETLAQYGNEITVAALEIHNSGYYKNGYSTYYTKILSPWRENNDYFEIIYTYFLYVYEGEDNFMSTYLFASMPMPGLLEDWYKCFSAAYSLERQYAANYSSSALLADLSGYMYYYFLTLEVAEEIKASGNQLWIDAYNKYNLDYIIQTYLTTYQFGYLYHTKGMIDSLAYNTLWDQYYEILKLRATGKLSTADHKEQLKQMYNTFELLMPTELYGFLSSLNLMYNQTKGVLPMLSYKEDVAYNTFTVVLRDYYREYLSDANKSLFADLLLAMENFALIHYKENAREDFVALMQKVVAGYETLSAEDKANFDEYCGTGYQKYLAIYNLTTGKTTFEATAEENALFAALVTEIDRYVAVYNYIASLEEVPESNYVVLHSIYAKATALYYTILSTSRNEALISLFTEVRAVMGGTYTLEKAYSIVDSTSTSLLIGKSATVKTGDGKVTYVTNWDLYASYGLSGIYAKMADLLYFAYGNKNAAPSAEQFASLMADIRALDNFDVKLFSFLGADAAYYTAATAYLQYLLESEAVGKTLATNLMQAEIAYLNYRLDSSNAAHKADFIALMEQIKTDYATLTEEHKAYLADMYNYYVGIYEELTAAPAA
jgi:hypothetical protein